MGETAGRDAKLVAPCGMNCGICANYLALRIDSKSKGVKIPYCAGCRIRNKNCALLKRGCDLIRNGLVEYCHQCSDYPCDHLIRIDDKYRRLYRMSMIDNLNHIKEKGVEEFLEREGERWKCPECGGTVSCHNGICFDCGLEGLRERMRDRKKLYRWEEG